MAQDYLAELRRQMAAQAAQRAAQAAAARTRAARPTNRPVDQGDSVVGNTGQVIVPQSINSRNPQQPGAFAMNRPQQEWGTPASRAQVEGGGQVYQNRRELANRFREGPVMAGSVPSAYGPQYHDTIEVLGPNTIRRNFAAGGSSVINTRLAGKPVEAHLFLDQMAGFRPTDEWAQKKQDAVNASLGIAPQVQPRIAPGPGGEVLERGGVSTPVENLSPSERGAAGLGGGFPFGPVAPGQPAGNALYDWASGVHRWITNMNAGRAAPALAGGGGASVPAGVSNAQAARIQTPTQQNPVPRTETSPQTDINKGTTSTAPVNKPQAANVTAPGMPSDASRYLQSQGFDTSNPNVNASMAANFQQNKDDFDQYWANRSQYEGFGG